MCSMVPVSEGGGLFIFKGAVLVSLRGGLCRMKGRSLCVLKGKPPTKKAKVLQKQPRVTKLVAFTPNQGGQQGGARKSGEHIT